MSLVYIDLGINLIIMIVNYDNNNNNNNKQIQPYRNVDSTKLQFIGALKSKGN